MRIAWYNTWFNMRYTLKSDGADISEPVVLFTMHERLTQGVTPSENVINMCATCVKFNNGHFHFLGLLRWLDSNSIFHSFGHLFYRWKPLYTFCKSMLYHARAFICTIADAGTTRSS